MEATRAEIERVASQLATRTRLVELILHGSCEWAVMVGGVLHPAQIDIELDEGNGIQVSFYVHCPSADADRYAIFADEEMLHVVPGTIVKGRPARLRLWFAGVPQNTAGV